MRLRHALVTLGALALAACTALGLERADMDRLVLENETADSVGFVALDRESSHLVDPVPEFDAGGLGDRILGPGASRRVRVEEIMSYRPGESVRFFVYRVSGGRARFRGHVDALSSSVARQNYRVRITTGILGG